jgi:bifunctional enzyme CysN/CysC
MKLEQLPTINCKLSTEKKLSTVNCQLSTVHAEDMNIVIVGHVDHGKSTIIGRLLADTGSLPEGKLDFVKELCRRNAKPFEYAFLLDALKDERAQGITIDAARCFFRTPKRNYIIIDAPGHIEFLKNMVSGASRAEAALLVIDAAEGVQENSRRHGYMLKMLGICQVAVLINKMDLVKFSEETYRVLVNEYTGFLNQIDIQPSAFIPVSGMRGDNIVAKSGQTQWYQGLTVLEILDAFQTEQLPEDQPFRLPVQDVYKFTQDGDNRRIIAGTVASGKIRVGDEVIFYPSGKKSKIATIEAFNREACAAVGAGWATGFTLTEQIYVKRGNLAALAGGTPPKVSSRLRVNLFWLGRQPMVPKKEYLLKLGSEKVGVKLGEIIRVMDAATLDASLQLEIGRHEVAECILHLERAIAFDLAQELAQTGRFVIVDEYEIAGGGIILEELEDKQKIVREQVILRNYKWARSTISAEERAERYNQKAALVLITGRSQVDRKTLAKALEQRLFHEGKVVYFLGIGSLLYGVDADIKQQGSDHREEHLRRLAEVANIMLDAGVILIITAIELTRDDLEIIKTVVDSERIETVWVGEEITTDIPYDLNIPALESPEKAASIIKGLLQERGVIFKPW